ncbi:MAG: FAD-dependent oxidoreductase [Chitinophagales bacterium]|jgi:monoamine oxidase|nr:FAD-dependent oxidoreductase [Chitinophagales bacterium]
MNRRKFIQKSLFGLPIVLTVPSLFTQCRKENSPKLNGKSVIIVGAGISGLAAAKKLYENGFEVMVLEAQDKVGGRLRTNRSLGFAFDEGASWIHGVNGNPITTLAQQAGMTSIKTDDDSLIAYDFDGTEITEQRFNQIETEYNNVIKTLKNSGSLNLSFEELFSNLHNDKVSNRLWKFFLSTYLTFDTGDLNLLSSINYDEGENLGGDEHIATNGYDTIPNYLAKGINIKLNQRVTQVNYLSDKVIVTHNGSESKADYVIVTVPLGVLKKNLIEFSPELPPFKKEAIQKVGINCVNKFLVTFDRIFWDDEQYIAYTPEIRDKFNYFVNLNKINPNLKALMTFAYADYARLTESKSDAEIISEIMTHLKAIYGNSIPNPTNLLRTKWNSNEFSYGSYSFTAKETEIKHFQNLGQHLLKKVFFAGEHTHEKYFSNAHGAYLSGIREADTIIELQ